MKTAVIGASPNCFRYSYLATVRLREHGHEVIPLGIHTGTIGEVNILDLREEAHYPDVDTVTMYLAPQHQAEWMPYILSLKPRRIIFNPGAENEEFARVARKNQIEIIDACTLVMLSANTY